MTKENTTRARVTVPSILARKHTKEKITALSAYDYTSAKLIDRSAVDMILVGDSLSGLVQGNSTTLPVTLDEMIYHCRCVTRGAQRVLVVGDMPFMSYQVSIERAIESACRMMKEGGVAAVKVEGGIAIADTVKRMVELDIPVVGHVGLTPQSVHRMGGYKVQGKNNPEQCIADAVALDKAGAFSIVVEGVPESVASAITEQVSVPTIGIGAGRCCDGQILVLHDLLGFHDQPLPRFVRRYASLFDSAREAIAQYVNEVKNGAFPGVDESYQ